MKTVARLLGTYLNTLAHIAPSLSGKQGFDLFCRPIRTPLKPAQRAYLKSAIDTELRFGKHAVQTYRWGHGDKKILFIHGWQSHSYRWKNYIQQFSPDEFSMYAFDAPGHGLSSGNALNALMYSDAIEAMINKTGPLDAIVGHSLGSFSSLLTLYRYPSLPVSKIVATGTPGQATDFIQYYKDTLHLSDRTMHNVINHFVSVIKEEPSYFSTERFVSGLAVPGLIIHDINDVEAPVTYAKQLHSRWENSSLVITETLGHNLRSPEVCKMVRDFVVSEENRNNGENRISSREGAVNF